ncbi:hypothetical protein [Prevotella communis]|uniref:hypothetical protein n=1 Tax=Prevotella communis TaxID=2913614 RepID=UPI001ED9D6F1|nr:hypothetical protein [Prevotella communis]UKK57328.1 hypothetical protein L6476_03505 [Prevotella communis]UKK69871.1 hypothetical protein L6466_11140 [Prevotella communis]
MKKLSFLHSLMAVLMITAAFTACSEDDDNDTSGSSKGAHYDLTITVGKHGGMAKTETHVTLSVASLSDPDTTITFDGKGVEITDYTIESIYDDEFMYQVPSSMDRFSKLQLKNNNLTVVQEQKFDKNTYTPRNYTHAWLDKNTLLIMSTTEDHTKVIWTKLNVKDMSIINEGTVDGIKVAEGYNVLSTSGLLAYRKSDKKLFYFYNNKGLTSGSNKSTNEPFFRIAVINPETMAVEQEIINSEAAQMQGSAYGELLQDFIFFDKDDNLYLTAFSTKSKKNYGQLLRIKNGEYDFEKGYNAFPDTKGKILTIQYLGGNKALVYSGDNAVGTGIQDVAYYYSIVDLDTKQATRLQYNGEDIAYSAGSFSQRSVYNAKENKAYFGVSNDTENRIYIYDVATGNVSLGSKLATGVYFDQIRFFEK